MPTHTSSIYLLLLLFSAFYLDKNIVLDDYVITYQIWDTAGQERFHSLLPGFVRGAQIALVVYDVTNPVGRRLFLSFCYPPLLLFLTLRNVMSVIYTCCGWTCWFYWNSLIYWYNNKKMMNANIEFVTVQRTDSLLKKCTARAISLKRKLFGGGILHKCTNVPGLLLRGAGCSYYRLTIHVSCLLWWLRCCLMLLYYTYNWKVMSMYKFLLDGYVCFRQK